ncbi:MAG: PBP1A family penicillin-binding protein [Treponema sp.]|nr:PBP1A family penicillin-binding protein [Treponema sp.]
MGYFSGNGFISALVVRLIAAFTIFVVILLGIGLGLSLAMTANIKNNENFSELAPALPTRLLDINGNLITEFASNEKRELVALGELPRHLIHAVLAREDPDFYNHRGFSIRAIGRAVWGQIIGRGMGGGSTISQQVAGWLHTDRSERTIKRKVKELWWAFQMERRYTKNEILEIYLNYMPMGPDTFGVETASRYFFRKSSRDVTIAESAVLAVLLSGPNRFDPIRNPSLAMNRQKFVLDRMVQFGYVSKEEAEASYDEYWDNFDWTQPPLSAYLTREDKAPWFSEYVRRELETLMYGSRDYFRDGYIVHTTLNLEHQQAADRFMAEGLERGNREYTALSRRSNVHAVRMYTPIINLLTLAFDLTDVREGTAGQNQARAVSRYVSLHNPIVDMLGLAFGINELRDITGPGFAQLRESTEQNVVEGALITIENETGYITAIVGGSKFDESNQLIRATQASVQPGSAFKPLYYSAGLDGGRFTAASMIYDEPMAFHNEDGTLYVPNNYGGAWRGPVLLYMIMSLSLNIPSLKVLETIGFDAAINRSALLLDITDDAQIRRQFPRVYPLGLGVNSTSPLRMARAFSIFANQGRVVTPMAIRSIEDRNGRVLFDIERDIRQRQARMRDNGQLITPQNAFLMTRILEFGVTAGTLAFGTGAGAKFTYRDESGRTFRMPVAGKTGTTQNWADAWTVGYTPYYTTAIWYGFDKPGNSLGISQTGAALAGPVWGDYMSAIHRGLPLKSFQRPSGIVDAAVCRRSGQLVTDDCDQGTIFLPFLAGSVPARYCELHGRGSPAAAAGGARIPATPSHFDNIDTTFLDNLMPTLQIDLPDFNTPPASNRNTPAGRNNNNNTVDDLPAIIPRQDDDDYLPPWDLLD